MSGFVESNQLCKYLRDSALEGGDGIIKTSWLERLGISVSSGFDGETLTQRIRWKND